MGFQNGGRCRQVVVNSGLTAFGCHYYRLQITIFFSFSFPDENGLLEYEQHRRGRIYLRRLSGSGVSAAAAEVFLRNQVRFLTFKASFSFKNTLDVAA